MASAPAYGRRAEPGSVPGMARQLVATGVGRSRRIGGSSRSVRLACCRAVAADKASGFRAVAADTASAPAYGRRARPGSHAALDCSRRIGGSSRSVRLACCRAVAADKASGFRAVAADTASAPAYGRRARPGSHAALDCSRRIGGSSRSVRLSCLSDETSAVLRRLGRECVSSFRAVAADTASAPACGRRAEPGSAMKTAQPR